MGSVAENKVGDAKNTSMTQSSVSLTKKKDAAAVLTDPSETDQFIIGDRVWVGGTKPGSISFIGETKFAPGEWAGVTLDQYIGKNDGSVGGIRYFQCEPRKGVFSRLTRLTREPLSDYELDQIGRRQSLSRSQSPVSVKATPLKSSDPPRRTSVTSERKPSAPSVKNGPSAVFRKSSSPSPNEPRIGESVVINSVTGTKYGILRFCGKTEFGDGVYGGVELDEPLGKNDGSVAGRRYFTCRMNYGLFAPMTRISRTRRASMAMSSRPSGIAMKRTGSRESLGASSVASSSFSTKGVRKATRPTTTTSSTRGLQDTLKEKTQQVDQLLHEKEMERQELAVVTNEMNQAKRRAEDLKWQFDQLQMESEERIHDLGEALKKLEDERPVFVSKLEEKQKQIDDLIFRYEEESIAKEDLQNKCMTDSVKIEEMRKKLDGEEQRSVKRSEMNTLQKDEFEEMELDLRASIDKLQLKTMNLEAEKEELEKKVQEKDAEVKELQNMKSSLEITVTEKDQKIELLQTTELAPKSDNTEHLQKIQDLTAQLTEVTKSRKLLEQQMGEQKQKLQAKSSESELKEKMSQLEVEFEKTTKLLVEAKDNNEELSRSLANERASLETATQEKNSLEEQKFALEEKVVLVEQLERENEQMKEKMDQTEKVLSCNATEKEELMAQITSLEEQLKSHKNQTQNSMEKELEAKNAEIQKLTESVSSLEKSVAELKDSQRQLQEEIKAEKSSNSSLASELTQTKDQLLESMKKAEEIADLQKQKEELAKGKQEMLKKSQDLEESLKSSKEDLEKATKQLEEALEQSKNLSENLEKSTKEHQITRDEHLQQIQELKSNLQKATTDKDELQVLHKDKETQIANLQSQIAESTDKQKLLEESISRYEEKLNLCSQSSSEQLVGLNQKLTQLEEQLVQEKTKGQALNRDLEETKKTLSQKSKDLEDSTKEKEALMADGKSKKEQIKELQKSQVQLEELQKCKSDNEEKIQKLTATNDSLAMEMVDLVNNLSTVTAENEQLKEGVNQLASAHKSSEEQMQTLFLAKNILEESNQELNNKLQDMKSNLEEIIRLKQSLEEALTTWQQKNSHMSSEKEKLQEDLKCLKKAHEELSARAQTEMQNLKSQLEASSTASGEDLQKKQKSLEDLSQKFMQAEKELEERKQQLHRANDRNEKLQEQGRELSSRVEEMTKEMALAKEKALEAEMELTKARSRIAELESSQTSSNEEAEQMLQKERHQNQQKMQVMEEEFKVLNGQLTSKNEQLKEKSSKIEQLTANIEKVSQSVLGMQQGLESQMDSLRKEKEDLLVDVARLETLVVTLKKDASENMTKLQQYESQDSQVANAQLSLELLQMKKDNRSLHEQLEQAKQTQLLNSGDQQQREMLVALKAERDDFKNQVDFLNSIIVDHQKQKMESQQPQEDTPTTTGQEKRKATPRMFCDICDRFDLHETEDCPQQTHEQAEQTKYHAPRGQTRPYCTVCEVFGHVEGECPDDTF